MIVFALVATLLVGSAVVVQDKDREHKKEVHYLKFHKESLDLEQKTLEALKKSQDFRI
jgi:hypothetical protein